MLSFNARLVAPVAAAATLGLLAVPSVSSAGTTTTLPAACQPTPLQKCRLNTKDKSTFQVKLLADKAHKNLIKFNWSNGEETIMDLNESGRDDFLDPANGLPTITMCVYDGNTLVSESEVFAGGLCFKSKPCWKVAGNGRSYKYKDKEATPSGITGIKLKGGEEGKARVSVTGKGILLDMPPLPIQGALTAQFIIDEFPATACFSTTFTGEDYQKNTADQFKAKGPASLAR